MKNSYYFQHDCNARNDEKCSSLRARHGASGYGIYWMLIEALHESSTGMLREDLLDGFCMSNALKIEEVKQVLSTCLAIGLLVSDSAMFYSERVMEQKNNLNSLIKKRRSAGRIGGLTKAKNSSVASAKQVLSKSVAKERKGKERKEDNNILTYIPVQEVLSDKENEFRKVIPVLSEILGHDKKFTKASLKKWESRRLKYSAEELTNAFINLSNEPDLWKLKNNGFRPLEWWLHSDERIEGMQTCHLKQRSHQNNFIIAG